MAEMANDQVRACIEKYAKAGYQLDVPAVPLKTAVYAVAGPLHDRGMTGLIQGLMVVQGTKGKFGFQRPDGIVCEGSFATFGSGESALLVRYRDVVGISFSTDGMLKGMALGSCTNGAQFQGEYFVSPGTNNGFGVATDSDGNVYKALSQ